MSAVPTFVRKEQMKSLIFCKSREFTQRSISLFNAAAFPAEKVFTGKLDEAIDMLTKDKTITNIVIDATEEPGLGLVDNKGEFGKITKIRDFLLLVYVKDDHKFNVFSEFYAGTKGLVIKKMPMEKAHFIDTFHNRNKVQQSLSKKNEAAAQAKEDAKKDENKSVSVIEASGHVKQTIDKLNELAKDRAQLKSLQDVGQVFNGFIGAFPYLESKDGYKQIRMLSEMIDNIARTYDRNPALTEVTEDHFNILLGCAKSCYVILKVLRENGTLTPEINKAYDLLKSKYDADASIYRPEKKSQDEVDNIFDSVS